MGEDELSKFATQVAGQAESGYPKIFAVDDDGNLKIKDIFRGMAFLGTITAVTDTKNFTVAALAGKGNDFFVDYEAHVVWDAGGASAAPQGEHQTVSDYVSTSGLFTIDTAYTAAIAVNDIILFVHKEFGLTYERLEAIQGGAYSIQAIMDELLAFLDLARSPDSGTTTMDGTEKTLYEEDGGGHPFDYFGTCIDFTGLNAGAGEDTTVKIYKKIENGGSYILLWESSAYLAAAVPDPPLRKVPNDQDAHNNEKVPLPLKSVYGIKVTATQDAEGGGWNDLDHETFDSKRGG